MINVRFNLRNPNDKKETPLNCVIRYDKKKLVYPTGFKIHPKYVKNKKLDIEKLARLPQYTGLNTQVTNLQNIATKCYYRFRDDHSNESPTVNELRNLIKYEYNPKDKPEKLIDFIAYFEKHLDELVNVTPGTIKTRRNTLNVFKAYKRKIPFESINVSFYNRFVKHLENKNYKQGTIAKHIRVFKTILYCAEDEFGIKLVRKKFKAINAESTEIYLNYHELELMRNLDLSKSPRLDRVRDLFLISCWTGQRYSDLNKITKSNIEGDVIRIKQHKTDIRVVIPIFPVTKSILEKYNYQLPRVLTNKSMNKYIKEVGAMIPELNSDILVESVTGNVKKTELVPKYKKIVTHTGRRTFCTNQYLDEVDVYLIMKISGHKTEKEFLKYIRMESDVAARKMLNKHSIKNNHLKAV